jgi:polyprenyl-phospho-N-acetylgalactosaminyl synthase
MNIKNHNVYVVIPAYNEEQTLASVIANVKHFFFHVVVVNDGSKDHTGTVAKDAGAMVVHHPINLGQGAALQTGIEFALRKGAEYIITFDADGQHDAADAQFMLEGIDGTDIQVALGSRFLGKAIGISRLRRLLLKIAIAATNLSTGQHFTDAHNGLRVMKTQAAERLKIKNDGMAHASEIISFICDNHISFKEFPITIQYTAYSYNKGQKLPDFMKTLLNILFDKLVH